MTHIVTAALVLAKAEDGSNVYLYRGSPVPANVSAAEVDRLVEGEFVSKLEPVGDSDEKPARRPRVKAEDAE